MSFVASSDTGITALNTVLAEEANRMNKDIYTRTVHMSPWIDLIKQETFPEAMGYQLTTLVYDRAIPTTGTNGNTAGVNWHNIALTEASNSFNTSLATGRNPLASATKQLAGPSGGDMEPDNDFDSSDGASGDIRSYINFSRQLKPYVLNRAVIESPRISLEDLRFAAYRNEQLRAIMDLMTDATRYTWENRNRDEYERVCANFVPCLSASTPILSTVDADSDDTADDTFEGNNIVDLDPVHSGAANADITPTANISNAILDKIYMRMVRQGAGIEAYGRENGRPVFALVISSEGSYRLQTDSGFRDDVRYNNSRVSDLIAPLGVEKSFRGFYHLIDDLAPRFTISGETITRVLPYTTSSGITSYNAAYETANYEAAYVIHPHVMCSQIPNPFSGAAGVQFQPLNYRGQFKWSNIPDQIRNPDGTIGFFRGVLAAATKPIKTDFGYVLFYKRDDSDEAA